MPQIIVENLSKTYWLAEREPGVLGAFKGLFHRRKRAIEALHNVSFSLKAGELVGLIGPNGAGKSTAIKILSGILRPGAGRCEVNGLVPWRDRIRHVASIGVVFGQRTQLWWDLPVLDSFDLLRDIYRVDSARYRQTLALLVELMRLDRLLQTPVRQLSLGQRMRCEIAAAMIHEPSILFLDEPTIGLDAPSKLAVRDFVKTLNRDRGVSVILTTHDMHDIEALAQRVIIIGNGRILRDGSFEALRAEMLGERRLKVDFAGTVGEFTVDGATVVERNGHSVELAFDPRVTVAHNLISRIAAKYDVEDVRVEEPKIEEVVARFYALHGASDA
jgi:ABC-2 type transport system ATP-binding protein